uniref:fasciculation and elongation protein zeta-2-like isoform X2 n=1 Tax=Myxine glutinosa TaxID=7769 RepID=UPI00358E6F28
MAAPLAHFDEDWHEFNAFRAPPQHEQPHRGVEELRDLDDNSVGGGEMLLSFQSMEDLVGGFEEKLTACFRNLNVSTDVLAPVKSLADADGLHDDELWNQVTDNYGNVMPVDWRSSHARSLYLPALNLNEHKEKESLTLDLPDDDDDDDDELREQLDMHSIIVSCVQPQEPLFTAEQVIEEIEEMMQESPDAEEDGVGESGLSGTTSSGQGDRISITSPDTSTSDGYSMDAGLRGLSVAQLMEHLEALESTIRSFSEELIQELALRDELEFEKEVKNTFIASLIEVQNKQKEFRELAKRKRRSTGTSPNHWRERGAITVGRTIAPGTYLTTIIPYEEKDEPPSVEQLQVLIKILKAMKDDSEKVPGLLTDYILKVLCPT